jgi:hypothetical protein
MSPQWFYARDGHEGGPVSQEELIVLVFMGQLRPQDLLWRKGFENWVPASKARGLFPTDVFSHNQCMLILLGFLMMPCACVLVSSILYYNWKYKKPEKAKQVNRLGFIAFGVQILFLMRSHFSSQDPTEYIPQGRQGVESGQPSEDGLNNTLTFNNAKGAYSLRYSSSTWSQNPTRSNPASELELTHSNNYAYALTIWEPFEIPIEKLRNLAIKNMSSAGTNPEVVEEGWKNLSGKRIGYSVVNATPDGIPVTYYGYYYSGANGSIQLLAWTAKNAFEEMRPELERLFGGLELPPDD